MLTSCSAYSTACRLSLIFACARDFSSASASMMRSWRVHTYAVTLSVEDRTMSRAACANAAS
eukprot:5803586-Pleurochrysis_carterae.AAC.1